MRKILLFCNRCKNAKIKIETTKSMDSIIYTARIFCPLCSNFAEGESLQSRYFAKKNAIKNWNFTQNAKEY